MYNQIWDSPPHFLGVVTRVCMVSITVHQCLPKLMGQSNQDVLGFLRERPHGLIAKRKTLKNLAEIAGSQRPGSK
jgi:hypothetical protein